MLEQERANLRHQQILDAALRVFAKKGYRDTAVDDIAVGSQTSKGGVYFHFPGKQAIFLALLDQTAVRLRKKIDAAIASQDDPLARADAALLAVLRTFASHRALARLFMVEALGAGREFHRRVADLHGEFASVIKTQLDSAVAEGVIAPLDTGVAGRAWFGALNEVITGWVLAGTPARLEDAYTALRPLLMRSVGIDTTAVPIRRDGPMTAVESVTVRGRLAAAIEHGYAEATRRGKPTLVSVTVAVASVDLHSVIELTDDDYALWELRDRVSLLGLGTVFEVEASGSDRYEDLRAGWRDRLDASVGDHDAAYPLAAPVCLAGLAFDPDRPPDAAWAGFPDGRLVLPRLLLTRTPAGSWLTVNTMVDDDADPARLGRDAEQAMDHLLAAGRSADRAATDSEVRFEEENSVEAWQQRVERILAAIEAGEVEKAVLARRLVARATSAFRPAAILDRLRRRYADCMIFAFRRGGACFIGATPERLVGLHGREFQIDALAGSAPRGGTVDEDEQIGAALLADDKERREHAFVVEALTSAVEPLSSELQAAATPALRRMANLQHLHTPVHGVLKDDHDVLDLVARLHPTPATGGLPRAAALALLRECEGFDRGWYAGPVGWVDAAGGGEFAVALRSALLSDDRALLFAGCGMVAGSEPEREYEESKIKLAAMRWALSN